MTSEVHAEEKRRRERRTEALTARIERTVHTARPSGELPRSPWHGLETQLRHFISHCLEYPEPCQRVLLSGAFRRVTRDFVRQARSFDPHLGTAELFQALRNVWIANSLQILLRRPVRLTPAIFAYSLLYPYTDNYCDNPEIAPGSKREMGIWLERRLRGLRAFPYDRRVRCIDRLVTMIEDTWPRERFPRVYQSLCGIHQAQMRSLSQQDLRADLSTNELLSISLKKGGTSVLADGYLVAGELQPAMIQFLFGYGSVLQLLDDLEDAYEDAFNGHETLFSRALRTGSLDTATERLTHFIHRVCRTPHVFTSRSWPMLRSLIERSSLLKICLAMACHEDSFSERFRADMERHSPWRFGWLNKQQNEKLGRRQTGSQMPLTEARQMETLLDLAADPPSVGNSYGASKHS
jgi:hypothetical protein